MTNKIFAIAATLFVAIATIASFSNTAEAGRGMKLNLGGPLGVFKAHNQKVYDSNVAKKRRAAKKRRQLARQRQLAKRKAAAANQKRAEAKAKQAEAIAQEKVETKAEVETETKSVERADNAQTENKVAALETGSVETDATETTCKKFVPTAGMTITVPCAN